MLHLINKYNKEKKAQVVFEYAIVLALVALALSMMQLYIRRGIQVGVKIATDEIGRQEDVGTHDPMAAMEEKVAQARSTTSSTIQAQLGGRHTLSLIETSEMIYAQNVYWGEFTPEDEYEPD